MGTNGRVEYLRPAGNKATDADSGNLGIIAFLIDYRGGYFWGGSCESREY